MRGIKIPQYEFALKMQGGLMRKGGRICGTLQYYHGVKLCFQALPNSLKLCNKERVEELQCSLCVVRSWPVSTCKAITRVW